MSKVKYPLLVWMSRFRAESWNLVNICKQITRNFFYCNYCYIYICAFVEAVAEIIGAPDLYLRAGSQLRLTCTLRDSTEVPAYVFWYHEDRMINYDEGVKVHADRFSSVLKLDEADKSHNGNYTCSPSNAIAASINVHVLNATAGNFIALYSSWSRWC